MNFIQLRAGPVVREDAVLLALQLEQAGHTLTAQDGQLSADPRVPDGPLRTALQDATVRRHICALLGYGQSAPRPR